MSLLRIAGWTNSNSRGLREELLESISPVCSRSFIHYALIKFKNKRQSALKYTIVENEYK